LPGVEYINVAFNCLS